MFRELLASVRTALATIAVCVIGYGAVVLAGAAVVSPEGRRGDLAVVGGETIGSWRIAQAFARDGYFWGRPSAVNYAADAAGGSNLSPTNPAIRERAEEILARLGATSGRPAPAELVTASGSGLDPDITERAALYQVPRVARARGLTEEVVRAVVAGAARPVGLGEEGGLVNVLRLNVALDRTPRANGADSRDND